MVLNQVILILHVFQAHKVKMVSELKVLQHNMLNPLLMYCANNWLARYLPTVEEKTYIWTRSHIEWDDGTSSNTVPTLSTLAKGLSDAIASIKINTNNIESKVSKTDYTGTTISSLINQDANTILIKASKIDLVGQVTFKSFDKDVQNKLSNATENSSNALNKANEANNNSSSALDKVTELENKANNGDFDGRGVESTKIEYKVTDDGITTPSNEDGLPLFLL